jgi:hypothetical protein
MQVVSQSTQQRPRSAVRHRGGLLWVGGTILVGTVLMFCYLRVAGVTQLNSDAAGIILQASDVLHGNLLLHGWVDTDVSFFTTELPEYMAVTAVDGVRPEVLHICAALTYTLLVVLAAFVARGRVRGPEGVVRALLAAGVMLAPQASSPGETFVLLGSPDHFGTSVPVLLLLLLLDRPRPRWYVPVGVGVLLAWSIVGDSLVEVIGVIPLALTCLLRASRIATAQHATARANGEGAPAAHATGDAGAASGEATERRGPGAWRAISYEVSIAAAAVIAIPVAAGAYRLFRHFGGYQLGPAHYGLVPWQAVVQNAALLWRSVLELYSADYAGASGSWNFAFALVHLVGVAAVIVSVALAVWLLVRPARAARLGDLVADVLVLAIVGNIAAYLLLVRVTNLWGAHEIAPVLPLGAALAGRMLGGPLIRIRRGIPILAAWLACSAVLLGIAAASPQLMPQNARLATWLSQRHMTHGMSSYWMASSTSVDTDGTISMLSVSIHGYRHLLAPDAWENNLALANRATHSANFLVINQEEQANGRIAEHMFGKPARVYRYEGFTIMVWNRNLLLKLAPAPTP